MPSARAQPTPPAPVAPRQSVVEEPRPAPGVLHQPYQILGDARFSFRHAYDNAWATNLPLEHFLAEDALLADTHDGRPITAEHGGPVRGMIPQLYAWKSAKWIKAIELVASDRPGFWEERGYHLRGDPWKEERYRESW